MPFLVHHLKETVAERLLSGDSLKSCQQITVKASEAGKIKSALDDFIKITDAPATLAPLHEVYQDKLKSEKEESIKGFKPFVMQQH